MVLDLEDLTVAKVLQVLTAWVQEAQALIDQQLRPKSEHDRGYRQHSLQAK